MLKRTIRSDFGEISVRSEGLIVAKVYAGVEIDITVAKTFYSLVEYLTHEEVCVLVVDISSLAGMTNAAVAFFQEQSGIGKAIAIALVTNSLRAKMLSNYFLRNGDARYSIVAMTSVTEAKQWAMHEYLKAMTKAAS